LPHNPVEAGPIEDHNDEVVISYGELLRMVAREARANPSDFGVATAVRGEKAEPRLITPDEVRYYYFSHIVAGRPTPREHQRFVTTLWYTCCTHVLGAAYLECGEPIRAAEATIDAYLRAFLWLYRRAEDVPPDVDVLRWLTSISRRLARRPRTPLPGEPDAADAPPPGRGVASRFTTPAQLRATGDVLRQLAPDDRELLLSTDGSIWPPADPAPTSPRLAQARRRFRGLVLDVPAGPDPTAPDREPDDAQRLRQLYALLVRQDTYPGHVCLNERSLLRHVHQQASHREASRRDEHFRLCAHCAAQLPLLGQMIGGFQPTEKRFLFHLAIKLVETNIVPPLREVLAPVDHSLPTHRH
jgi:hypothetical protein